MAHKTFADGRNQKKAENSWDSAIAFGLESNNRKLISAILEEAERIDDDLEDVVESSHIDTATGKTLERFGALLPLDRLEGEPDAKYRTRIKAELAKQRTKTDFNDFVEFIGAILGISQDNITLDSNYAALPAVITLRTQKQAFENAALTNQEAVDIIQGGVPAGHEVRVEAAGTFTLKADGDADTAENGLTSDTISTGGTLAADLL